MNSTEREIYDKYAYKKTHIYLVYEEFERRVNSTDNEYEGLKKGECSFNYSAWEKRLGISKKLLQNSIKQLVDDNVIIQTFKGGKGRGSSKYFLIRFDIENMDNKKDNNLDNNSDNYKDSNYNGSNGALDNKMDNNLDNKMDNTSIYNNLNIKSNNIYVEIIDYLNKKANTRYRSNTKDTRVLIKKRLNDGFLLEDFMKVIDNKILDWKDTEYEKYIRPKTLFSEKFERYLNEKVITKPKEEPIERGYANLDDL